MLTDYYREELNTLRSVGVEFSKENPAIAPMLGEPSSDPDVERLLEGVAFLTGNVRERMDDEFPELIHNLLRQLWPHGLRPVPSVTMMHFSPDRVAGQISRIPSETYVDSKPIDGLKCRFRTCGEAIIHPMKVVNVSLKEPAGDASFIQAQFEFAPGAQVELPETLNLFLGGRYRESSLLYMLLMRQVAQIRVRAKESGDEIMLPATALVAGGMAQNEAILTSPANGFDGYRLLQEFFLVPQRFTNVNLRGLNGLELSSQDTGFVIDFILKDSGSEKLNLSAESFMLSIVPAVNIFSHPAIPMAVDHTKTEYNVRPEAEDQGWYQIYDIEAVSGFIQGGGQKCEFEAFHSYLGAGSDYIYSERVRMAQNRKRMNFGVSIAYPSGKNLPELASLSFDVLCTNGFMPEQLEIGDIHVPVAAEQTACRNITPPTVAALPALGSESLWKLISVLTLNDLSLTKLENLKALLGLFLMDGYRNQKHEAANRKRIDGILELEFKHIERLVGASLMRGTELFLMVDSEHFAGRGDLYLFGTVLERFIGLYAAVNSFTRLRMKDVSSGDEYVWKERIGDQFLV